MKMHYTYLSLLFCLLCGYTTQTKIELTSPDELTAFNINNYEQQLDSAYRWYAP